MFPLWCASSPTKQELEEYLDEAKCHLFTRLGTTFTIFNTNESSSPLTSLPWMKHISVFVEFWSESMVWCVIGWGWRFNVRASASYIEDCPIKSRRWGVFMMDDYEKKLFFDVCMQFRMMFFDRNIRSKNDLNYICKIQIKLLLTTLASSAIDLLPQLNQSKLESTALPNIVTCKILNWRRFSCYLFWYDHGPGLCI